MEKKIEILLDTQAKYNRILTLAKSLNAHMFNVIQAQKSLAELFSELSFKQPDLHDAFTSNANTQKSLVKNGDALLSAIRFFIDAMDTLVNKTTQDTVMTVKQYQYARVQFDAYRNETESSLGSEATTHSTAPNGTSPTTTTHGTMSSSESDGNLEQHKSRFETLHKDVDIKLKLLDENRVS